MPDSRINTPYPKRIHQLRMAVKYTKCKFARVMGIPPVALERLLSGGIPTLYQIRRLRLMERAFAEPLNLYLSNPRKYGGWGKTEKVYEPYGGLKFTRRMLVYKSANTLPIRAKDIEALGGMEIFGRTAVRKSIHGRCRDAGLGDEDITDVA